MTLPWTRLIRFEATDGRILRGEPVTPDNNNNTELDLGFITEADSLQARVLAGDDIFDTSGKTHLTDEVVTVRKILGPLTSDDVPILRCVGLNYARHSSSLFLPICLYMYVFANMVVFTSQGSREIAPSFPVHLLQAQHDGPRSQCSRGDSQDCAGRPGGL